MKCTIDRRVHVNSKELGGGGVRSVELYIGLSSLVYLLVPQSCYVMQTIMTLKHEKKEKAFVQKKV